MPDANLPETDRFPTHFSNANLATNNYYDHRGDLVAIAMPGGIWAKHQFDGAGRDVKDSTTDGGAVYGAAATWANANATTYDVVLEQTLTTYDSASNPIATTSKQRWHNATGGFYGDLTSYARYSYTAMYYDAANRLTDSADYGTNGGSAWTRPSTVPSRSDTVLVDHIDYDAAGRIVDTIDPRAIETGHFYDLLGRETKTIEAWDGSGPTPIETNSTNQITTNTYDGDNHVLLMTAMMPGSTPSQQTAYVYGVSGTVGTNIFSNDLLATIEYPNASTGVASTAAADDQSFAYNFLGQKTSLTDHYNSSSPTSGSVHGYNYDVLGRLTGDIVNSLGTNLDGSVRRLGYTYDTAGRPYQQTSYSDTAGTSVVNQVQDGYNGYGQKTAEYQAATGAVNTSTTPYTGYTYSQPAGANFSRLSGLVYPNGRVVDYAYGTAEPIASISSTGTTATATYAGANHFSVGDSIVLTGSSNSNYNGTFSITAINTTSSTLTFTLGSSYTGSDTTSVDMVALKPSADKLDNAISRVADIQDHAGSSAGVHEEEYSYLGLSTIVIRNRPEDGTQLTYVKQAGDTKWNGDGGDQYTGFDRFGCVIDQYWLNTSNGTAVDRFQYGYDRDGNLLYKNNLVNPAFSELYHPNAASTGDDNTAYDPLGRITSFSRGTLTASTYNGGVLDTITTANLNSTTGVPNQNNWNLDALGNWASTGSQTRTVNSKNQYTAISGATTPTYDNSGNTTVDQAGKHYTYDAWNRMVLLKDTNNTTVLLTLKFDALGRIAIYNNGAGNDTMFYGSNGNIVEEKYSTTYDQLVWGLGYVNALILRDRNPKNAGGNLGKGGSGLNERQYANQDANWDTTSLLSQTGSTVVERFCYDPYGTTVTLDNTWAVYNDTSVYWQYKWQGERYEGTGMFYFMGARFYSVTLGRFLQQEPYGAAYVDGSNLYQGELSAPTIYSDPTGMHVHTNAKLSGLLITALQQMCPCVNVSVDGSGNIVATTTSESKDEFCDCRQHHGDGCKLVHDLLMSDNKLSIGKTNLRNGFQNHNIMNNGGNSSVRWNPAFGGGIPGAAGFGPTIVLAHELGHVWNEWYGFPKGFSNLIGPTPPGFPGGNARWRTENFAVMTQNEVQAELLAESIGPAFDYNGRGKTWGQNNYSGIPLKTPFADPLGDTCNCASDWNDLTSKNGWK